MKKLIKTITTPDGQEIGVYEDEEVSEDRPQLIEIKIDPSSVKKIEYSPNIEYNESDKIIYTILSPNVFKKTITKVTHVYNNLYGEYFYNYKHFSIPCENCKHELTLNNITRRIVRIPKKLSDFTDFICEKCEHPLEIRFETIEECLYENPIGD